MNSKLLEPFSKLSQRQIAHWTTLAIITLCLLSIFSELLSAYQLNQQFDFNQIQKKTPSQPPPTYQSKHIIDGALFGKTASNRALSDIKLPTTRLKLVLRGAFTASSAEQASAIIEGSDNKAKHYKVGSTIFGQTQLKAVYSDRVILTNNGQLETLYFPKPVQQKTLEKQLVSRTKKTSMSDEQRQALIKKRLQELRSRTKR